MNMKKNKNSYFLFLEKIPLERLRWIERCISKLDNLNEVKFFLSGDALFSLVDSRYKKNWTSLFKLDNFKCILDYEELNLLGFEIEKIIKEYSRIQINANFNPKKSVDFWDDLINSIYAKNYNNRLGFLEFRGPYMSRTSVKVLRLLEGAIRSKLNPQLFTYLDGIHLGHLEQRPSEFENIGEGLLSLKERVRKHNLDFTMLSCSRCGTARGYLRKDYENEYKPSEDAISGYLFCNLNRIIDYFEENGLILAPTWASIQASNISVQETHQNKLYKPPLVIFITHSPYGSEWTFGGLSFAMACANHGIPTNVVFIEDGIYSIHGTHKVNENDKIFNIQEIIIATYDMEDLHYYAFEDSLQERNMKMSSVFDDNIKKINDTDLNQIVFSSDSSLASHKRVLFF